MAYQLWSVENPGHLHGRKPTGQSVHNHFDLIYRKFKKHDREALRQSGTSEDYNILMKVLTEYNKLDKEVREGKLLDKIAAEEKIEAKKDSETSTRNQLRASG